VIGAYDLQPEAQTKTSGSLEACTGALELVTVIKGTLVVFWLNYCHYCQYYTATTAITACKELWYLTTPSNILRCFISFPHSPSFLFLPLRSLNLWEVFILRSTVFMKCWSCYSPCTISATLEGSMPLRTDQVLWVLVSLISDLGYVVVCIYEWMNEWKRLLAEIKNIKLNTNNNIKQYIHQRCYQVTNNIYDNPKSLNSS